MFPVNEFAGTVGLPEAATYWVPKRTEIDEEGFGYFLGVWSILDVGVREARAIIATDVNFASIVGGLSGDAEHFDRLATIVEEGLDSVLERTVAAQAALSAFVGDDEAADLECLELGVAGLVYALALVGMFPAASCRGHVGPQAWSTTPVVLFAADQYRAEKLQPLAERTGCHFTIDTARPELLVVGGRSIADTMALAQAVFDARADFRPPRRTKNSSVATPKAARPKESQLTLFE